MIKFGVIFFLILQLPGGGGGIHIPLLAQNGTLGDFSPWKFYSFKFKMFNCNQYEKKSIQQELYLNLLAIESKPNHIFEK